MTPHMFFIEELFLESQTVPILKETPHKKARAFLFEPLEPLFYRTPLSNYAS